MPRTYIVHVPLERFRWAGNRFELYSKFHVVRRSQLPDLGGLERRLAADEIRLLLENTTHWLEFEYQLGSPHSPAELVNLFLLSLWLQVPTKTRVSHRFKVGIAEANGETKLTHLFDRMNYVEGSTQASVSTQDLMSTAQLMETLLGIPKRGRINDAIILTLQGCWQGRWQAAIMLFASAAEALLTYSTAGGLTKRLAIAYACLTQRSKAMRDSAYVEFRSCYQMRSDVVHGRGSTVPVTVRVAGVGRWGTILRILWLRILSNKTTIDTMGGSDARRAKRVRRAIGQYLPP